MKLSERLRNAVGVGPFSHAVSDESPVVVTAGLLREAAELARSVEDAEVAHVEPKNGLAVMHERCVPLALIGKRVRIVPEAGQEVGDG